MTQLITTALLTLLLATPVSAGLEEKRAAIDDLVNPLIEQNVIVGLTIGLIDGDDSVVIGYGRTDLGDPAAPDAHTIFEIGSITKTFTALLLALAVERGDLAYDQQARSLLPEGKRMPHYEGREIALEHLATHTSGLPRLPDNLKPPNPADPYAHYSPEMLYVFLSYWGLDSEPGTQYLYSNLGMGLLGELMAGKGYEQMTLDRICKPLGMNETFIEVPATYDERMAKPYDADFAPASHWQFLSMMGAGALNSTGADMVKYMRAQMDADGELGTAMRATQQSRHATGEEGMSIGLGWHVRDDGTRLHDGGTGGFASFMTFNPDKRVGVVVLSNTAASQAYQLGPKLQRLLLGEAYEPFDLPNIVTIESSKLDRYVGRYQLFPGFDLHVKRDGDRLFAQATNQPAFGIYPTSEFEFFYRVVDAQLTFVESETGRIEKLILHQGGRDTSAPKLE